MKRIITTIAMLAVLATPIFAQNRDNDATLVKSEDDMISLVAVDHWGYGYHFVTTDSYTPAEASQVFLNILKLKVYPIKNLGLEVGADIKFDHFLSVQDGFRLDANKKLQAFNLSDEFGSGITKKRGWTHFTSLSIPAVIKLGSESLRIGAGIEGSLNFKNSANYKFKDGGKTQKSKDKGMDVKTFDYNFVGMLTIGNTSIFGKYYPNGWIVKDGNVNMSYWTLGVGFGF